MKTTIKRNVDIELGTNIQSYASLDSYLRNSYLCDRNTPVAHGEEDVESRQWPGNEASIPEVKANGKRGGSPSNDRCDIGGWCLELKSLKLDVVVRYWQDSDINGKSDNDCEEGSNEPQMPFADYVGDENRILRAYNWHWRPTIDIDNGRILGWPEGTTASIHYKVCDEFYCEILDDNNNTVYSYDGYVPRCMCPKEDGYGDYIIMDIDDNGFIQGWVPEHVLMILEQED